MNLSEFGIVCPACKSEIEIQDGCATCPSCQIDYPLIHGIVDLRYPPVDDGGATKTMAEEFHQSSFDELLCIMLWEHELSPQMYADTLAYYHDQFARTERMLTMFENQITKHFKSPQPERVLDLGCGSGAGVRVLSNRFNQVIGLDVSLAQLLLAQKMLENTPIINYQLICGYANRLPFKDQSVDSIQAINVLEHVMTIEPVLSEISRILISGGIFIADSRNRFDIFFPEPHTGIRFLGFLPQKFIPKFVQWRKKTHYEQTRLLSYGKLHKAMRNHFRGVYRIDFPDVKAYRQPKWVDQLVTLIKKFTFLSKLTLRIFPTHIVVGKKSDEV